MIYDFFIQGINNRFLNNTNDGFTCKNIRSDGVYIFSSEELAKAKLLALGEPPYTYIIRVPRAVDEDKLKLPTPSL